MIDKDDEAVRGALTRAIARLGHAPGLDALAAELSRPPSDDRAILAASRRCPCAAAASRTATPWVVHPFAFRRAPVGWRRRGAAIGRIAFTAPAASPPRCAATPISTPAMAAKREAVTFKVANGALIDTGDVFHLSTPAARWWDNVIFACASFPAVPIAPMPWTIGAGGTTCPRARYSPCRDCGRSRATGMAAIWTEPWKKRSAAEAEGVFRRHGSDRSVLGPWAERHCDKPRHGAATPRPHGCAHCGDTPVAYLIEACHWIPSSPPWCFRW